MINNTGKPEAYRQINLDLPIHRKEEPENTAKNAVSADSFKSGQSVKEEYIVIIPPSSNINKPNTLFKTVATPSMPGDLEVKENLPAVDGVLAKLTPSKANELKNSGYQIFKDGENFSIPRLPWDIPDSQDPTGIRSIEEEYKVRGEVTLNERPPLEGPRYDTPLSRQYNGKGITVAIIDSGLYPHPDFMDGDRNRILATPDFVNEKVIPYDDHGHGTHVAGCAAGSGSLSNGLYKATAPEADIVSLKALSGSGSGKTSSIIKAIQWAIENKEKYNIRVINMSLGHLNQADYWNDPTDVAVKKAFEAGIAVIASAGNRGKEKSLSSPGSGPYALGVAAADDWNTRDTSDDKIAPFSSRGPTMDNRLKPDLAAPGEAIISTLAPGTEKEKSGKKYRTLMETMRWYMGMSDEALQSVPKDTLRDMGFGEETIERWFKSPTQARKEVKRIFEAAQRRILVDSAYVASPGTSMAAPIVAGIAAKVFEANPDLTPGQLYHILRTTADKIPDVCKYAQGAGMVDPEEAIQMALDAKAGLIEIPEPEIHWFQPAIQLELEFPDMKPMDKNEKPAPGDVPPETLGRTASPSEPTWNIT